MKKTLCALGLLLASSYLATAQTEKGTKAIGGGFGISTNSSKDNNNTNIKSSRFDISIMPAAEYFVADNLSIRGQLGAGYSKYKGESPSIYYKTISKSFDWSANVFARKYIPIMDKKLFVFVDAGLGYYHDNEKLKSYRTDYTPTESTIKTNRYYVGAYSGLAYFISPKLGIESSLLQLEYSHKSTKSTYSDTSNGYDISDNYLGLGLVSGLNLSVKYYFK